MLVNFLIYRLTTAKAEQAFNNFDTLFLRLYSICGFAAITTDPSNRHVD
jgi:hypothetical protein